MAKVLILRPIADISVEHIIPDELESTPAYALLDEEIPDDALTSIYAKGDSISVTQYISTFKMSAINIDGKTFKGAKIILRGYDEHASSKGVNAEIEQFATLTIGDKELEETYLGSQMTREWDTDQSFVSEFGKSMNDFITENKKAPEIKISLRTCFTGTNLGGNVSGSYSYFYISQLYIEIEYEEIANRGIYIKANGVFQTAHITYQKIDGKWSEISEDEAKTILKNNNIRRR